MGVVDEGFQLVGGAEGAVRREGEDAVVAPVAGTGDVGEGHELDGGDAEGGEVGQAGADAGVAAEKAHVQLVDDGLVPRAAVPKVAPGVGCGIDDDAGAVDVVLLEARGRVGDHEAVGEDEVVGGSGRCRRFQGVPAAGLRVHRGVGGPEAKGDGGAGGCPEAETGAPVRLRFGAEGQGVCVAGCHSGRSTRVARGGRVRVRA